MTTVAYGIAFPASHAVLAPPDYSAAVQQFFARASSLPDAWKPAYANFIDALVNGGVWAVRDWAALFAAPNQSTALTELKGFSITLSAVNAPTFTAKQGFNGNGSNKYIDTTFTPADGVQLQQNSASFSLGVLSNQAADAGEHGAYDAGFAKAFAIAPRYADEKIYGQINETASTSVSAGGTSLGLIVANRSGAASTQLYRDGTSLASATNASTGRSTAKMALCAYRTDTTVTCAGNTEIVGYAAVGGSMTATQALAEYNAWQQFLSDIAGL